MDLKKELEEVVSKVINRRTSSLLKSAIRPWSLPGEPARACLVY